MAARCGEDAHTLVATSTSASSPCTRRQNEALRLHCLQCAESGANADSVKTATIFDSIKHTHAQARHTIQAVHQSCARMLAQHAPATYAQLSASAPGRKTLYKQAHLR